VKRQTTETKPTAPAQQPPAPPHSAGLSTARDVAANLRRYGEELETRYVAARDEWMLAMRAANSGRAADLASLAIAQEAYETVAIEREQWLAGGSHAIPVEPATKGQNIEVAVGQELAWRRVLEQKPRRPGVMARLRRLFGGR